MSQPEKTARTIIAEALVKSINEHVYEELPPQGTNRAKVLCSLDVRRNGMSDPSLGKFEDAAVLLTQFKGRIIEDVRVVETTGADDPIERYIALEVTFSQPSTLDPVQVARAMDALAGRIQLIQDDIKYRESQGCPALILDILQKALAKDTDALTYLCVESGRVVEGSTTVLTYDRSAQPS